MATHLCLTTIKNKRREGGETRGRREGDERETRGRGSGEERAARGDEDIEL